MLLAQARRGYIGHSSEAKPRGAFGGRTAGKWVTPAKIRSHRWKWDTPAQSVLNISVWPIFQRCDL